MKKMNIIVLTGLLLLSTFQLRAAVTVTGATGGANISADNSATATNWTSLGAITIVEPGNGKGDIAVGTGVTLVLKTPAGFEFNTARTNVTFTAGRDITFARGSYLDSATLTITMNIGGTGAADTLTIGGTGTNALQVRPTAGTPLAARHIYRPTTSGGTATITGVTAEADGTGAGSNFGTLSEVAGNVAKLVFTTTPASATVGLIFGTQPVIRTLDQFNNNTLAGLGATLNVTIALTNGTGPLLGTTTTNIGTTGANGVINATNLRIDSIGSDKQLSANATGLAGGVSGVFTVNQGSQTITFPAITNNFTYGDAPFTLNATASSGLTVSYAVLSGPATVVGNTVTITGAGSVTIEASQAGDANWTAASNVSSSFTVAKATPTLTWSNPADIVYGTALGGTQLNATPSTPGTLLYSPAAGTVLNAGTNQALSVDLTPTDSANYNNATATVFINVNKADQTITFNSLSDKVTTAAPFTVSATASSGLSVSFSIFSGPATISGDTVTLDGTAGTVTVRASQSGDANFNAATNVDQSFNVNNGTPTITWNTPADLPYGTALGTNQLNATANVPGAFAYTPDFGTVLPLGTNQTLSVTFTPTDTNSYSIVSTNVSINVVKATPVITWATPAPIVYGTTLTTNQLNAAASVSGVLTYTPDFDTVLNAGSNQVLSVSFVPDDTTNYNNASATVLIDVLQVVPTVTWATPSDIVYGTALSTNQLNATASVAGSFVYSPDLGATLNAGAAQTLSLTFTPTDSTNYATVNTSVLINVLKATPAISWATPSSIVYGTALTTNQLNATAAVAGTLVYTPAAGTVLDAGLNQQLSVVFTPTDSANYNGNSASVFIDVAKATSTLTWAAPADIVYNTALSSNQLNATASTTGTFVYSPDIGTVLSAGPSQTLNVSFTPADTNNYTGAVTSVSINVLKATPSITWSAPSDIIYGTALSAAQLNASSTVAGTYTYTPTNGTVLNAGTNQTLSVSFVPNDTTNYDNANASVSINVLKATPVITWSNPADITYGEALSSTQLNATSDVAGVLTYTPDSGVVLNAGAQSLSVSFVPTDTANYNNTSTNVSINVLKASTTITWSDPASITYGTALSSAQLNATASVSGTLVYSPSTGAILNAGTNLLGVTFTPTDTTNYNGTNATVSIVVTKATPVITWSNPADINFGTALSSAQLNASSVTAGTFTYNPTNGTVLNAGAAQTLSVDFAPTDSTNYTTASTNVLINVLKTTPTISWSNPASIIYGTTLSTNQLNASSTVAGSFVYTPDVGALLNAGTNQTLSVSFTPTDTANYNNASTNVSITVLKATPTISWSNPTTIVYGTALGGIQLNASASVAGTLTYTPAAGTILNAGNNQTLSVSLVPTDTANYNNTSTNVLINVTKAPVTITWSNPADINYGTALGAIQLNATASTAGTFVYTPGTNAVLNAGANQTLSVSFTPSSANFSNATASVSINVSKVPLTVKANDATRLVGQANPAFSATYSGFVNSDTSASLTAQPTFSTIADTNSAIGFYDIVPSGATSGNYNISFVNGILTVSPTSTIVSTATGGNWSAAGTWVGGVVPTAADNVAIAVGATVTVDTSAACFSLTLSNSPTAGSTLTVSATRSLSVGNGAGLVTIGQNQTAVTTASVCLVNVAGTLQCGNATLVARRISNKNADAILRLSNASAVVTVTNNITGDRNIITGGVTSQVEFTAAGLLKVGGGFVGNGTLLPGTGTVEYNANGDQTVAGFAYNNVTLSGSGSKTGSAAVTIGATGTLLLKDTAIYAGVTPTYTAGSTLFYARTGAQVTGSALPTTSPANWNLSVSNAAGITLRQSPTVTGTLRLLAGNITTTPTNTLTADGTVIRTSGYVIGNLRKNFILGSNVAQTFEVGGANYTPVSITFSNVTTAGHVTVAANPGKHAAIATSILDASKGVNLNWTATKGPTLVADAYNAVFNFNSSDVDATASTSLFILGNYATGTWTYPTVAARTATSLQVNALTTSADFQIAESGARTSPTITWNNPADIIYPAALSTNELNATANVPGTFVYNPTVATVLNAGNAQTLSVTFTPTDLATYSQVTTSVAINVLKATPVITWNDPASITYGTALSGTQLNAGANVAGSFSYSPDVGAQPNAGTNILSALFIPADTTNYNVVNPSVSLVVLKATPSITWSDPAPISYGTLLDTNQLNATATVSGSFVYSPAAGASLNVGTNVLGVTFTPTDTLDYNSAVASVNLLVTAPVPSITWSNPADITYNTALSTNQLNATASVPGTFAYTPDVGAILSAGTNQTLNVTFTPADTNTYQSVSTNVVINVLKATPSITWATPASIVYGNALTTNELSATADVSGTFSYTPDFGAQPNAGTNTLNVSFVPNDTTNYNNAVGSVSLVVTKATPVITWNNPADITYGTALGSSQLNAGANVGGTFSYSPTNGTVLNAGSAQSLSVIFNPTDAANYNSANASVSINVLKAPSTITWSNPGSITYGTALSAAQLNATASVAGSLVYTPDSGAILNAGTNTLSVTFTPTDSNNYDGTNATVSIVVSKATPQITWSNPANIVYGTPLGTNELNATISGAFRPSQPVAGLPTGTFTYTPPAGTVLNVGTNGLSVSFVPDDAANYNNASANVTLVVTTAATTITWTNPTDIVYGTTLSTNELNATANTAGTFTYTPDLGAVVATGTNTLNVSFVPNDTTNYGNASATVTLVVTKRDLTVVANDATRQYGLTNPVFTGTLSGVVAGDNISATYASSAVVGSNIGSYAIIPSLVDPNSKLTNYTTAITNGTLAVTVAPLSVVANNQTKVYGSSNPTLTGVISGIRNSDNISASYSSIAVQTSPVGTYPITITVLDPNSRTGNYSLSTTNGVLSVVKDTPSIAFDSAPNPITVGGSVIFTATISSTNVAVTNGFVQFTIDSTNIFTSGVSTNGKAYIVGHFAYLGNHPVQATYLGDANRNSVASSILTQSVVALPQDRLAVIERPDHSMIIRFVGDGVSTYTIQRSSNFSVWSNLGPASVGTDGLLEAVDGTAGSQPFRFYRFVKQ